jgi:ABC-2 type transport system ATP-binding protein
MSINIEKLEIKLKSFNLRAENFSFQGEEKILIAAANGSGKSMFLKGVIGLVPTLTRRIKISGEDISKSNLLDFIGVYLGEEFLIPFYTPREYFELIGKIRGLDSSQINLAINGFKILFKQEWPKKYIRELSTGMKKKVGLAGSLIGDPKIILWDEPFETLDDEGQRLLKEFIENDRRLVIYSSPVSDNHYSTRTLTIQEGLVLENVAS